MRKKRNHIDYEKYEEYKRKRTSINQDPEVIKKRITENLLLWEEMIPEKYKGIPYDSTLAKNIKSRNGIVNAMFTNHDMETNNLKSYKILKHLINFGISPSEIFITDYEDCLQLIRGYGDDRVYIRKLFSKSNKAIFIYNLRSKISSIDNNDNYNTFWKKMKSYCKNNGTSLIVSSIEPLEDWNPFK